MAEIFVSHSRRDSEIRNWFATIFGRTNVRGVFMQYETLANQPWPNIQAQIVSSAALFVLLGPNVETLHHTQMWVGSEATFAQSVRKEVWVFEHEDALTRVPILATLHYMVYRFDPTFETYIQTAVNSYDDIPVLTATLVGAFQGIELTASIPQPGAQAGGAVVGAIMARNQALQSRMRPIGTPLQCAYDNCQHVFFCHNDLTLGLEMPCPVCRRPLSFQPPQ